MGVCGVCELVVRCRSRRNCLLTTTSCNAVEKRALVIDCEKEYVAVTYFQKVGLKMMEAAQTVGEFSW